MTTNTLHPLAAEYLERLRRAGRGLPPGRLRELLAEIEGHLSEAIDPSASDAQALTVLDKLGEAEAIIAAETPDPDELPARRGTKEWAAIILLLLGGFIFGVGWFAGLILLWNSRAWTTREKWIGTLVIPGGLATSALVGGFLLGTPTETRCRGIAGVALHCTSAPGPSVVSPVLGVAVLALLVLAPIATSVYLTRRAAKP
jgi:HAAS domain-containing protein